MTNKINQEAFSEIDSIFRKFLFSEHLKAEIAKNGTKVIPFRTKGVQNARVLVSLKNGEFVYDVTYTVLDGIVAEHYAVSDSKISNGFSDLREALLLFANGVRLSAKSTK